FNLADDARHLLLVFWRPSQNAVEHFFDLTFGHAGYYSTREDLYRASGIEASTAETLAPSTRARSAGDATMVMVHDRALDVGGQNVAGSEFEWPVACRAADRASAPRRCDRVRCRGGATR